MKPQYINIIKDQSVLIIGSGRTIKDHYQSIKNYIAKNSPIIFGINRMTGFFTPHFHLWTNKQRYRDLGQCIKKKSQMMFGQGIPHSLIRKHHKGKYFVVYYKDSVKYSNKLVITKEGVLKSFFRTAGSLAVALTKAMGAKTINMVGIDGFSLHSKKDLKKKRKSHHCYGKGFTDDASYEKEVEKDKIVYNSYKVMSKYGIDFKILTPTKYKKFFDPSVLGV